MQKTHDLSRFLLSPHFSKEGSALTISTVRVTDLVEEYGTPLYVYDAETLADSYREAKQAFDPFEVFFSFKANPSLAVCAFLRELGAGAELASAGELHIALKAGFAPEKIIFAGPAKMNAELALAVKTGIASVNVESFVELARLEKIAKDEGLEANASIRVNTSEAGVTTPEVMAGGPSRFGIDEEIVIEELNNIILDKVDLVGVHVYTASQILRENAIQANLDRVLKLVADLQEHADFFPRTIIFGGGLGIPYAKSERELDMQLLGAKIAETLDEYEERLGLSERRLIIELGRFLTARSGVFISRVIDAKESRGVKFIATNGGINNFIRPRLMDLNHPTFIVNKLGEEEEGRANIGGPLCTPIDIIADNVPVPEVERGDLVGVFNAGAYGYSMGMHDFLGHRRPAEVLILNGEPHLIREGTDFDATLRGQSLPESLKS